MLSPYQSNKSLSPRSLPKLSSFRPGKVIKETSPELGIFSSTSPSNIFQEIEKKLLEQQKEIMSRDTAVKKVIYNFENIIEAHSNQKAKTIEYKGKYLKLKKEFSALKEANSRLNEIIMRGPESVQKEAEEKLREQVEVLSAQIEKRNSDLQDKENLAVSLKSENEMLRKEMSRILNNKPEVSAKYSSSEVKTIIEKNLDLEKDLKLKEEALTVSQNQALYLKESLNIVNAELKTLRYSMNNLKKSYFKLKEGQEPDDEARVSKKSMSRPPEEIMTKSGSGFYMNDPKLSNLPGLLEPAVEERLKLLKEVQDLSEASMKLRENDMMQNQRMKHLEKELTSLRELASGYKKRFEEQSVEINLLNETISYKDEKIKRDAERLKYYKTIEPEFALLRKTNKELEETCKHFRNKTDKLFEVSTKEKEKWLAKEQSYYETINSLVKEVNSMKSKDENSVESSSFGKLLEIDNENKSLRKEIDEYQRNSEQLNEKNKELRFKLEHVVFLLNQSDEVFKCSSCFVAGKNVGVIIPCLHLVCKECSGSKCKECYSSVVSVVHPGIIESLSYLISQLKSYCRLRDPTQT